MTTDSRTVRRMVVATAGLGCRPAATRMATPARTIAAPPRTYWAHEVLPCPSPEADETQPVYEATDVTVPVTFAIPVCAEYPTALRDQGATAEVEPALVAAARDAAMRSRFHPAQRDRSFVRQRVTVPYSFLVQRQAFGPRQR
jgi:hypothetical protein